MLAAKEPGLTSTEVIKQAPISESDALAALLLVMASMIYALAHRAPQAWWCAWLGLALMAFSLSLSHHRGWLSLGLLSGGLLSHWVGFPWYYDMVLRFTDAAWGLPKTLIFWVMGTLLIMLSERIFLLLAVLLPRSRWLPVWCWLPLGWWLGEVLRFYLTGLRHGALLFSQWQAEPVLRLLGHWGWVPATLFCLGIASLLGHALARRSLRLTTLSLMLPNLLWFFPPLSADVSLLKGVGAVHMADFDAYPRWVPPDVKFLLWPEVIRRGRPRVSEDTAQGLVFSPPVLSAQTYHLFGQETRTAAGTQNSLLAMAPDGTLLALRAKRLLFPLAEKPLWGIQNANRIMYLPGQAPAYLDIAGLRVAALLCYEEFARHLALEARQAGAQLLTVSATERLFGGTIETENMFLGISVLLAVETGLPVLRSSLAGPAALIAPNGQILRQSASGTSGILTLEKDWKAYIRRAERPSF